MLQNTKSLNNADNDHHPDEAKAIAIPYVFYKNSRAKNPQLMYI